MVELIKFIRGNFTLTVKQTYREHVNQHPPPWLQQRIHFGEQLYPLLRT